VRILVIEDHALVREGLLLALRALEDGATPAELFGAADAAEATQLLTAHDDYDLILLDLMLPGTGGMAFLGVIRKLHPQIPVVILSAQDDADTVMKAIRQGAAGFVSKASPTEVLLGALREVLTGEVWLPLEYRELDEAATRRNRWSCRHALIFTNTPTGKLE
jgi:DNA-binding NarL/FixJ family response regulator